MNRPVSAHRDDHAMRAAVQRIANGGDGPAFGQRGQEIRRHAGGLHQLEGAIDPLLVLAALGGGIADEEMSRHLESIPPLEGIEVR